MVAMLDAHHSTLFCAVLWARQARMNWNARLVEKARCEK